MVDKIESVVRTLLAVAIAIVLVGCAQGTPQEEQTAPKSESIKEEIHLAEPVAVTDREASGQWNVSDGPTWLDIWDSGTDEKMEYEEIDVIYSFLDLKEFDDWSGEHDYPNSMHAALSDGTEGDIKNQEVINDLWERVLRMRLSPDLAMTDPGTFYTNELVFTWDDGRTQTFSFKGHTALSVDGTLFPIIESLDTGIEVFNGPVVIKHLENWKYPDTVFDIVRMVMEDELGKRGVIITKSGSSNMDYSRDSFDWDAGDDGMVETYNVKHIQESDGSRDWVRIKATNMSNPPSCEIEGAERLYVVEKKRDDKDHPYLEVTYQPQDSEDKATCIIKMENDELVVKYQ